MDTFELGEVLFCLLMWYMGFITPLIRNLFQTPSIVFHCPKNNIWTLHHSTVGHQDLVTLSSSPYSSDILPPLQSALVHLGCYNKNTIDLVDFKQQKFITHSSGSWVVQDQGTRRIGV